MEFFGQVESISLQREGTTSRGNHYEVQNVEVRGQEHLIISVYGTTEHLSKAGITVGAEGKFAVKTSVSDYNQRKFNRIELIDVYRDFMPLGGRQTAATTEPAQQKAADNTPEQVGKGEAVAESAAPQANDDLPF